MKIRDLLETGEKGCYLAAEVGTNHNGSLATALEMIGRFADLGAHGLKFQFLKPGRLYPAETRVADYLVEQGVAEKGAGINEIIEKVEFKDDWIAVLGQACREAGVEFLCSVFDPESLDPLIAGGLESIKIASTEITHYPLLEEAGQTGLPIILSTGMAGLGEVEKALGRIGHDQVILLHCTAAYPTQPAEVNLRAMVNLGQTFGLKVGFSDHTQGSLAGACAACLGACLVEKHVTLDHTMPGPDHHFAAEPEEFQELAQALVQTRTMLGSAKKKATGSEKELIGYRPGVFAAQGIGQGEEITREKIRIMRRNKKGIGAEHLELVLGRRAKSPIAPGQVLEWSLI